MTGKRGYIPNCFGGFEMGNRRDESPKRTNQKVVKLKRAKGHI